MGGLYRPRTPSILLTMKPHLAVFLGAFAVGACNADRATGGSASGLLDDSGMPDIALDTPAIEVGFDTRGDSRDEVVPDVVPDVVPVPDTVLPPSSCLPAGFEIDCSDPQWQVPLEFSDVGEVCSGELLYRGEGQHMAYGTRSNAGILTLRPEDGGLALETRGVNPPTGVLCQAWLPCEDARLLTSFEGPGFGAAFIADGDRTAVIGTVWGAHRSTPVSTVETGPIGRAWATGDSTSWLFLAERDGQITRWRDVTAATRGEHAGIVGTMAGAGSGFAGVGTHRYYALGNAFDGLVEHTILDSRSFDGPVSRAWPVSGLAGTVALAESALDRQLSTLGEERIETSLQLAEPDRVAVNSDLSEVGVARLTPGGQIEFARFDPETRHTDGWQPLAKPGSDAELISLSVEEEPAARSIFALTYATSSSAGTELFVARPTDPRCQN